MILDDSKKVCLIKLRLHEIITAGSISESSCGGNEIVGLHIILGLTTVHR